ncbi:hypothetical protein N9L47_08900 [Rhodobacteraceae bacterium]|nr:hypothetical protein [Paracoccaceae bacterium]
MPYSEIAGYSIAQVENSGVCFAAAKLTSDNGDDMLYTYYQAQAGQRWHVAGYVEAGVLQASNVGVDVSIDGTQTLMRETETRDGDFMLPFEALAEIRDHEKLVKTGETMVIGIGGSDRLRVPLGDYRAALGGVLACLIQIQGAE